MWGQFQSTIQSIGMNTKRFTHSTLAFRTTFYKTAREEHREMSTEQFRTFMHNEIDEWIFYSMDPLASPVQGIIQQEESHSEILVFSAESSPFSPNRCSAGMKPNMHIQDHFSANDQLCNSSRRIIQGLKNSSKKLKEQIDQIALSHQKKIKQFDYKPHQNEYSSQEEYSHNQLHQYIPQTEIFRHSVHDLSSESKLLSESSIPVPKSVEFSSLPSEQKHFKSIASKPSASERVYDRNASYTEVSYRLDQPTKNTLPFTFHGHFSKFEQAKK